MHKSVPKVQKVLTLGKVSQKIQKSGGGVRPVLDEVQIKAAFFFWEAPLARGGSVTNKDVLSSFSLGDFSFSRRFTNPSRFEKFPKLTYDSHPL